MTSIKLYVQTFIEATPDLAIPLWQVLIFVVLISFAALFERYRFILICAYVFLSYWVFIENGKLLTFNFVWVVTGLVFLGIGLVAMLLTLYYMLTCRQ